MICRGIGKSILRTGGTLLAKLLNVLWAVANAMVNAGCTGQIQVRAAAWSGMEARQRGQKEESCSPPHIYVNVTHCAGFWSI
jgi:hypothetical protein